MVCPKCKAKIGITSQQIILDTGIVNCSRCVICGYLAIDHPRGIQPLSRSQGRKHGSCRP